MVRAEIVILFCDKQPAARTRCMSFDSVSLVQSCLLMHACKPHDHVLHVIAQQQDVANHIGGTVQPVVFVIVDRKLCSA